MKLPLVCTSRENNLSLQWLGFGTLNTNLDFLLEPFAQSQRTLAKAAVAERLLRAQQGSCSCFTEVRRIKHPSPVELYEFRWRFEFLEVLEIRLYFFELPSSNQVLLLHLSRKLVTGSLDEVRLAQNQEIRLSIETYFRFMNGEVENPCIK